MKTIILLFLSLPSFSQMQLFHGLVARRAGVACVSSNPNDVTVMSPLCSGVAESTAKGWKMQGGTVVGLWAYDPTKWMVASDVSPSTMSYGANSSNGTFGYNVVSDSDPQTGIAKHAVLIANGRITDTMFAFCAAKVEGGLPAGSWYLPNSNEGVKIVSQLGSSVVLGSGTQHSAGVAYAAISTNATKSAAAKFSSPQRVRCYRVF